jgi:hypothetical protein
VSAPYITEECLRKLDTKQQTNTLLNLVWRDSASEEVFTRMASICHTLMVQHRMMVPKVRQVSWGGVHRLGSVPSLCDAWNMNCDLFLCFLREENTGY